ncbi:MAG: DHHA1 domain-containing protein [Candidatus Woesearchaeota archaeon]
MISIYCSEKLDGVAAAAIIMRHAILTKLPAHFGGFLHPDALEDEFEDMAQNEQQLIFVLDIGALPEHLPLIEKITQKNKIVYWNTHDAESVIVPAKIFDRATEKKCSAELAQQRFLPNDLIARKLAQLAHEVTFWQMNDENASRLSDLIAAGYNPLELIDALARGALWNPKFEDFHKKLIEKKMIAHDELMKTLVIKSYVNYRFGFGLAASILTTADACQKILDGHAGVDVAVVLYRDGRIGFRRRDGCDVNVKELAALFKGGGMPFAAGARLPMSVSKENFPDALFYLDQAFKNFFVTAVS